MATAVFIEDRFGKAWRQADVSFDRELIESILAQWEILKVGTRLNILFNILGLRPRLLKELQQDIEKLLKRAVEDNDEWIRVMGDMLDPLIKDPPANVELKHKHYLKGIKATNKLLKEEHIAWNPLENAFLVDSLLQDEDGEEEEHPTHFTISPSLALQPMSKEPPKVKVREKAPVVKKQALLRKTNRPLLGKRSQRGLRIGSSGFERRIQKRTIKKLSDKQLKELAGVPEEPVAPTPEKPTTPAAANSPVVSSPMGAKATPMQSPQQQQGAVPSISTSVRPEVAVGGWANQAATTAATAAASDTVTLDSLNTLSAGTFTVPQSNPPLASTDTLPAQNIPQQQPQSSGTDMLASLTTSLQAPTSGDPATSLLSLSTMMEQPEAKKQKKSSDD